MAVTFSPDYIFPLSFLGVNRGGRKTAILSDYRRLDGDRTFHFVWRMENLQEKGRYTEIKVLRMRFVDSLPKSRFSIRALRGRQGCFSSFG